MTDTTLRSALIKLAHDQPELRVKVLQVLKEAGGYTKKEITIPTATEPKTLDAEVKGNWAIYPSFGQSRAWTIAHIPSGAALKQGLSSKKKAVLLLDAVLKRIPDLLHASKSGIMAHRNEIVKVLKNPPRGPKAVRTVAFYLEALTKKVVAYDRRLSRRDNNYFRLDHLMTAIDKIEKDVSSYLERTDDEAMDALRKSIGVRFIVREFNPAKAVIKMMERSR